jgi:hypothetical protein
MKLAVLFSLTSGAILRVLTGSLRYHDLRLLRGLWEHLQQGDILLGDRAYGEYTTLAGLPRQGVDVVARLHQRRRVDFRKARRLGQNDGLFGWTQGCQQSEILSAQEWALLPAQITVRMIRFTATIRGFRARRVTRGTTLLDPKLYLRSMPSRRSADRERDGSPVTRFVLPAAADPRPPGDALGRECGPGMRLRPPAPGLRFAADAPVGAAAPG